MSHRTVESEPKPEPGDNGGRVEPGEISGPGPVGLMGLAVWLGLVGGFLELAVFVLIEAQFTGVWGYLGKIRHYPWTIPMVNVLVLVLVALPMAAWVRVSPTTGRKVGPVVLVAGALMPTLMTFGSGLYFIALLLLATGIASFITRAARRRPKRVLRWIRVTTPIFLVLLAGLAAWRIREEVGPRPSTDGPGGPNVLLIVLDTVRADHLRLVEEDGEFENENEEVRHTSPELAAIARRGVTFAGARSTSPWTLPSHASMMTGKPAFEAALSRYSPMIPGGPTLAETLAERGYDTVGMVANIYYCAYSTGINRGFAHYEDLPVTPATVLASSRLGRRLVELINQLHSTARPDEPIPLPPFPRIDADAINRRFLDWLDQHREGEGDQARPFFAFLNYFDAHDPYVVPEGAEHRFGKAPETAEERRFMDDWWLLPNKNEITAEQLALLVDGYDSCIAYLDDRIGRLLRELERRGVLDETVVVITSDHGEAFGEHGLFGHGGSLYENQLHVPLIVMAPGRAPEGVIVEDAVSLRDLPATILDLVGADPAALPGASLVGLWGDRAEGQGGSVEPSLVMASVESPDFFSPNEERSPVFRGAMISILNDRGLKYIRIEGRGGVEEQLYALPSDPGEERNLASPMAASLLNGFRAILQRIFYPSTVPDDAEPPTE